ncbi:hypothetical protein SK128_007308 [Halocaridina rubra]|uniref:Uncharacterized protein n=1 Tax=Halocaridina rubra TaxID=373956 RepID=A0AAN8XDW2_HALRR
MFQATHEIEIYMINRLMCVCGQPYRLPPETLVSSALIPEPPLSYQLTPGQVNIIYSSRSKVWSKGELVQNFCVPLQSEHMGSENASRPMTNSSTNVASSLSPHSQNYRLSLEQVKLIFISQFNAAQRDQLKNLMQGRGTVLRPSHPTMQAVTESQRYSNPNLGGTRNHSFKTQGSMPYTRGLNPTNHHPTVMQPSRMSSGMVGLPNEEGLDNCSFNSSNTDTGSTADDYSSSLDENFAINMGELED